MTAESAREIRGRTSRMTGSDGKMTGSHGGEGVVVTGWVAVRQALLEV